MDSTSSDDVNDCKGNDMNPFAERLVKETPFIISV